ncbi:MAG: tripartite tricarboxylate transporter TctB family protein [Rhodobacter sp.]|jgi:hypothetical protein|nr:tripartite tricarboxylate transporter TctB family protein [Rhodobacter sp.]
MFNARTATTAVMLAIFVAACALSLSLPSKAAFMPLLIGVPGALLCAAQLLMDIRRAPEPTPEPLTEPGDATDDDGRSEAEVFVWLGLFFAVLLGFGFIIGAPLIVFAFVRFSSRESWRNALIAGAGTFVVMYGVFVLLLELSLFPGLVLDRLF